MVRLQAWSARRPMKIPSCPKPTLPRRLNGSARPRVTRTPISDEWPRPGQRTNGKPPPRALSVKAGSRMLPRPGRRHRPLPDRHPAKAKPPRCRDGLLPASVGPTACPSCALAGLHQRFRYLPPAGFSCLAMSSERPSFCTRDQVTALPSSQVSISCPVIGEGS